MTESAQVDWFEVYAFAERLAANHGAALDHVLIAGTPRWCGMPDDDARKLLALVLGGVRDALTNDAHQTARQIALAEASREIACSTDWSAVARQVYNGRGAAYIPRRSA
jgi:hypothetical protein